MANFPPGRRFWSRTTSAGSTPSPCSRRPPAGGGRRSLPHARRRRLRSARSPRDAARVRARSLGAQLSRGDDHPRRRGAPLPCRLVRGSPHRAGPRRAGGPPLRASGSRLDRRRRFPPPLPQGRVPRGIGALAADLRAPPSHRLRVRPGAVAASARRHPIRAAGALMGQQSAIDYIRSGNTPFFRLPSARAPESTPGSVDAIFLGVTFDSGTTYQPGARFAPYHLRRLSALVQGHHPVHRRDVFEAVRARDGGNVGFPPYGPGAMREAVDAEVSAVLAAGAVPVVAGGDHSIALPVLRALARKHGPVAVVHVDAHFDTSGPGVW